MELSKEEYERWKSDSVTKIILGIVEDRLRECQLELAEGATYARGSVEQTAMATAEAIGEIRGLNFVMDIDFH